MIYSLSLGQQILAKHSNFLLINHIAISDNDSFLWKINFNWFT